MSAQISAFLQQNVEMLVLAEEGTRDGEESGVRLLDYACGTGIVTKVSEYQYFPCVCWSVSCGLCCFAGRSLGFEYSRKA